MQLRHFLGAAGLMGALALATPALAHDVGAPPGMPGTAPAGMPPLPDPRPEWKPDAAPGPQAWHGQAWQGAHGVDPRAREDWLAECRRRVARQDRGLGGAAIGGLLGGLIGNRVAGKGNRTVGTVAGAVVGGAAGMAIDKAEDRGRDRDWCESYLDDYYARHAQPQGPAPYYGMHHGYAGYAYVPVVPMMMVPAPHGQKQVCTKKVITETIEEPVVRRRHVPRVRHHVPDKRVRVAPDKRVRAD